MILFTTGDILSLTSFPYTTLDQWTCKGLVQPIAGGHGHGNPRQWSLMQAVGWVVADQQWHSDRGCVKEYVGEVVNAFGSVSEKWLDKRLARDGRHLVMISRGRPVLQTVDERWGHPNVLEAYQRVKDYKRK